MSLNPFERHRRARGMEECIKTVDPEYLIFLLDNPKMLPEILEIRKEVFERQADPIIKKRVQAIREARQIILDNNKPLGQD